MSKRRAVILSILFACLVTLAIPGPASACVEEPGTIVVHKFNDVNGNGTQDPGEDDIEGWKIRIYRWDSTGLYIVGTGTTGPDGRVKFADLVPTRYKVWEEKRDCWQPTTPPGLNNWAGGYYTAQYLDPGQSITVDFGNRYTCGYIGDTVWQDDDGDGVQDAGEPGIPDVTVDLNEPGPDGICGTDDDVFIGSDVTDANGNYLFTDLPHGGYCVDPDETTVPAGYELTTDNDPETVYLGPGENYYLDADFGYQPQPASVGDRVWYDNDGDGVQDAGEAGIYGVTVNLTDCAGNILATDVTDGDGLYLFDGLAPGTYCVEIDGTSLPDDVQQTYEKDGTLDGNTQQPLAAGDEVLDVDFGYQPQPATVGDRVWYDDDGDGVQDPGEAGIPGVTVNLTDCAGGILATDVTDANGNYLFDGLAASTYCVVIDGTTLPASVQQTFEKDGTLDGDTQQPLNAGDEVLDVDFGYQPLGSIGDTVWQDDDGDGVQDAGEPGIPGVTVDLNDPGPDGVCGTDDDVFIASDTTDANGNYWFTDLPQGTYCVDPDETTVPAGYELTANNDPETVDLGPGEEFLDADFGYQPRYTLGDRVWYDQDQDGIQDANEPGVSGITVELFDSPDCSGVAVASTTTDGTGFYQFTGLPAGDYCIAFSGIPMGWEISPQDQGADDTVDSDADGNAQITNILLTADDPDEDMGIYESGSIGDRVWCESPANANTEYNPVDGDFGLRAIGVTLYADGDCDGTADGAPLASVDSDGNGFYTFSGLEVALAGDAANQTCYVTVVDAADPDLGACNSPITPTEHPSDLDSDNPDDFDSDFGFRRLTCDLAVTKSCLVTPAPTDDLFCTDKIVATTLRYNGPTILGATVEIDPDKSPTVVYSGVDLIAGETVLTLPAENGFSVDARPDEAELGARAKIRVNGVEEVIHTSCSAPYMAGQPAPLDNPKGDPSPNWFVENFLDKDSPEVVELPAPPEPSDSCQITLGPTPSCETEGKPASLTFIFTGGTCAESANTQGSKFTCTDYAPIAPGQPVEIVYVGKDPGKFTITPEVVMVGDELVIDTTRADFHSETKLELYQGGTLVQFLNIHTSCSAPLAVGDVFASLELVAFDGATAGNEVTYTYEVTNLGDRLSGVTLFDIPLGDIDTGGPFSLATGETRTFQTVVEINETVTNEGIFSGFLINGAACSGSDFATVTVIEPCAECKAGTTELTFQYLGTQAANVVVYDDKDAKPDKKLFEGLLQPGDEFTITPRTGQDDLNNDISMWVERVFNAKIHTSCSQPIGPGLIAGDLLIVEGRSKDNGLMCPLNTCAPDAAPAVEFHDREIKWDITNNGDVGLEISRIEITWPQANGYLDEVKRDGDAIHKEDFLAPSSVIDSGWEGNADKRTIKPGETDTLKFKFQNDAVLDGAYNIVVEFTYGCSIELSYAPPVSRAYFDCSKPIDSLTMIWNGATTDVWVTAWYGDVGSTVLTSLIPVSLGAELTVSGYAGSQNDVVWEIFADASGMGKLGESTFHLSCSDNDMNDALDCGKRQGDGKDQSGFHNDWILEGLVDSDETLNCTRP